VVGVARDVADGSFGDASYPLFYLSRLQDPGNGHFSLVIRTAGNPYLWAKPLLEVARSGGPHLRLFEVESLEDTVGKSLWEVKWQAGVLGALGLLAILLAAIGVYGVVAHSVSQRTREIGVRMAVGAAPADVHWMVLAQGLRLTALGIAAGLLLSAAAVRLLRGFLYGLSPFDPLAFAVASLAWIAIAMLASWFPARRATRVDPLAALKYE
jgi:ABC-type antimicrobial peptide transport system permease subunit